ncbi:hypothetical protein EHO59_06080 [Leptospira semungkisensis]|uniref:Uncharacterized protein n=1 Tax=Leptospira semungkisensis TaxID=2484985 RepID=A0A4R9G8S7_9LEPT|nr:hypothetical protein [Leptospira semungkisensis]TGK07665.1 hypothetical protein EHO59_06080 [Leptospira semungkisensis]
MEAIETQSPYFTRESGLPLLKEAPILSLKGISLTPICVCPQCGSENKTPWAKSRGRLRDWAAFLEEVRFVVCTNESCMANFTLGYLLEFPKGTITLNKSNLLKAMVSWFEEFSGQPLPLAEDGDTEDLRWDPFFHAVPNWADHIPITLFTNILRYTPPKDLEGILLGRKGISLFGGFPIRCVI